MCSGAPPPGGTVISMMSGRTDSGVLTIASASKNQYAGPRTGTTAGGAVLTAYTGCPEGSAVELYTLSGEGHEWPGGPSLPVADTSILGPQSNAVNADAAMWQFFNSHPLP